MGKELSERRQIENEVVFRQANERVQKELVGLEKMAAEEGYTSLPENDDISLHFYCECSDENCRERIIMKLALYNEFHSNRKQFLISPDHETLGIERVILKDSNYTVVEKFATPPETAVKLQHTDIVNV
ncbi:hypothetical protein H0V99_03315 [Candidatus Saccharibacteria bacterium]|nr:hypothetical protein [Candidatus Saccharibacteria bacterium]